MLGIEAIDSLPDASMAEEQERIRPGESSHESQVIVATTPAVNARTPTSICNASRETPAPVSRKKRLACDNCHRSKVGLAHGQGRNSKAFPDDSQ